MEFVEKMGASLVGPYIDKNFRTVPCLVKRPSIQFAAVGSLGKSGESSIRRKSQIWHCHLIRSKGTLWGRAYYVEGSFCKALDK